MGERDILKLMQEYIKTRMPDIDPDKLETTRLPDVFEASFDVLEFLLYLEEKLDIEEEIDLEKLGPKFTQSITFAELAGEVKRYLDTR